MILASNHLFPSKLSGQEYVNIGARQAKAALAHGAGHSPGGDLE